MADNLLEEIAKIIPSSPKPYNCPDEISNSQWEKAMQIRAKYIERIQEAGLTEDEAIDAYENNNPTDDHATGVNEVVQATIQAILKALEEK